MESSLRTWESVKNRVHDVSGIDKPENWLYESKNGIFYPVENLGEDVQEDIFDKLNPDMTDDEMEALGYEVKYSVSYGEDDTVNFRENCGHAVLV